MKTPADGEVPPTAERSVYIWNRREILAEYDESAGGSLELYKQYFRAAGRLVAVKMYGFHGRREPGPEGFLHTKGGLMYYHTDRLGSPVAITDRHGEPVARYAWDAYGRAMAGVFGPYNSVGFSGKMRDGATGLTYFGARWYDADSGRFMSRDPIRDGWNWYAYVGGDPVNYVDTWGLLATEAQGNKGTSEILSVANVGFTATEGAVGANSKLYEGKSQGQLGQRLNSYGYPKGIGYSSQASKFGRISRTVGKIAVTISVADVIRETSKNGLSEGAKRLTRHTVSYGMGFAVATAAAPTGPFAPIAGATAAIIIDEAVFGGTNW